MKLAVVIAAHFCIAWPFVASSSIFTAVQPGNFAENGFDRLLVEDCFRRQDLWQSDLTSHCHEIATPGTTLPTLRLVYRHHLYRHLVEQDQQDQHTVFECLRNATIGLEAQSDDCNNLIWGRQTDTEDDHTLRQSRIALHLKQTKEDIFIAQSCLYDKDWQENGTHYCYQLVGLGQLTTGFSERQLAQKVLYEAFLEQDSKDRDLVRHCVQYHQFDAYEPCRGITWDIEMKVFSEKRQTRIESLLAEMYQSKLETETDPELQLVLTCLYSSTWTTTAGHHCHSIVRGEDNTELKAFQIERLHKLFSELRSKDQVTDCFDYHREDQLPACYGLSWDLKLSTSGEFFPYLEIHRKIWHNLLKLDKCKISSKCL